MHRHPKLVPLSHEHQRLLFVCRYLKKDAAPYEGFPLEPEAKLAYIVKIFKEVMVPHLQKEDYLFEACTGHDPEIDKAIRELQTQHRQISTIYGGLLESKDLVGDMDIIAGELEEHIRREEREVYQWLQDRLPHVIEGLSF
ncbi:hemerythrin domain-containing protein [Chitinophaga sedimenti]|uniref:hemerythrin domain-containing protein n=1 Tax=Chitinophaga sedimenti TaxID=2033606 RepID=UPI00200589BC|nr:hemerythrin domain-containing protein [Chitinophaga sedimenti]MCK7553883.1 hemerythrin domain-containing protein [Chitinophaga sedimenti]